MTKRPTKATWSGPQLNRFDLTSTPNLPGVDQARFERWKEAAMQLAEQAKDRKA